MKVDYDVIIVGAGPGGLSAAIYAARYKLKVLVFGKLLGGWAGSAHKICNFPSYIEISGMELMKKILEQVKALGVEIISDEVKKITGKNKKFIVETHKEKYNSKKIIYAGGTVRKKLGVKDEEKYIGKGLSYCATCDATFFKGKIVVIIGGGDSALTAALLLSEYANEVIIVYKQREFDNADPTWQEQVKKNKKIRCECNEEVVEIIGDNFIEAVKLKSGKELKVQGVFVEIGSIPDTYVLSELNIKRDKKGYIIVDKSQKTNIDGFYAVGDITNNILKQIITAGGEGAVAGFEVYREVKKDL